MHILYKAGPLLTTVPFGTEKVLTCMNIFIIFFIIEATYAMKARRSTRLIEGCFLGTNVL